MPHRMPAPIHPAQLSSDQLLGDCDMTHGRGSGPGGQRRNKVQTAVRITHRPTKLTAEASERRSQAQNLAMAVFRLRVTLAIEVRTSPTEASALWTQRTRTGRIACNVKHADYPAMLAEAIDQIMLHRGDVRKAARVLEVSSTQLIRFIATQRRAFDQLNALREKRGLHRLHE